MTSFDFEEYRQPWETGPHWELKREFLETYKNDYPVDRLLCLAQAYSNIELLHCSYPEAVMHEVERCSYNLKGNKGFREMERKLEKTRKENSELQSRKGKRSLSGDSSSKPFKLIKFCSASESKSLEESVNKNECLKTSNKSISCKTDLSVNNPAVSNCKSVLTGKDRTICIDMEKKYLTSESSENDISVIYSFPQSQDFDLMKQIADAMPKKCRTALLTIESVLQLPDFENATKFVFVPESESVFCCHFYIGDTLVSTGRDSTEKWSRIRSADYALEILTNLSNLPSKTLRDIKHEWLEWQKIADHKEPLFLNGMLKSDSFTNVISEMKNNPFFTDLYAILTIVTELQKLMKANLPAMEIIKNAVAQSKSVTNVFYFNFGEDPNTLLHEKLFHCDLVIGNVLICHAKNSSKKKSKIEVAERGIILLNKCFDINEDINHRMQNYGEINVPVSNVSDSSMKKSKKSKFPKLDSSYIAPSKKDVSNFSFPQKSDIVHSSKATKNSIKTSSQPIQSHNNIQRCIEYRTKAKFKMNEKLLRNSWEKSIVLFDQSESGFKFAATPASILQSSMDKCKKSVKFSMSQESVDSGYSCTIYVNGENVGKGSGSTKQSAKLNATENAVAYLQNTFYTIKVKNEAEDGFIITRQQVLNGQDSKTIISESNIGHKMLKMMGWTGGAIGKSGGIIEPIVAKDHNFHQGLGFSNNKGKEKSFKQNIEGLLQNYSCSKTTSDLIFSTDFTKKERKDIHMWTTKYNLQSQSAGSGRKRQLFIRHKWTVAELLHLLVEAGGSTRKYELVDKSSCQTS